MTFLGLFKRDKSKKAADSRNTSTTSFVTDDDDVERTEDGYVLPASAAIMPSLMNRNSSEASITSPSSSKIKLPFRNKYANASASPLSRSFDSENGASDYSTVKSSVDLSLNSTLTPRSRPSISSVFPSVQHPSTPSSSTRSLPQPHVNKRPTTSPLQKEQSASASKAGGGLFSWARERKLSKPAKPKAGHPERLQELPPFEAESFNLKSFRHVQADLSPNSSSRGVAQSQSPPNSFVSPSPRPRGGSMASDTSQRISVAAFREAQARRSSTNLASQAPSPTMRPVSLADPGNANLSPPPRPPRAARPTGSPARDSRVRSEYIAALSSDDDTSSEDEDSDSGDHSPSRSRSRVDRQRTITKHNYGNRARSDLGHGTNEHSHSERYSHHQQTTSSRSELGHGSQIRVGSPFRVGPPPSSFQKSSSGFTGTRSHSLYKRQRASYSTSELEPSAATQRASIAAAANARDSVANLRQSTVMGSDTSESNSNDGSSSDDDDAPLSQLMNPKRPGSAFSHRSQAGPQQRAKPLIDLNTNFNPLTGKPMTDSKEAESEQKKTSHLRPLLISPTDINNRLSRLTAEAGLGNHRKTLASRSEDNLARTSGSASPQALSEKPATINPSSPTMGIDIMVRTESPVSMKSEGKSSSSPSSSTNGSPTIPGHEPQNLNDDKPLRPIPIRERNGNRSGFKVVSRPQKSPTGASPSSKPQSPVDGDRLSQYLQNASFGSPSISSHSPSPSTVTKYPPRTSSFTVTSRPLSGGSEQDIQTSSKGQQPTRQSGSTVVGSGRFPQTQSSPVQRPFVTGKRRDSPSSSTGGSSNGKAPLTPMDGSDYFSADRRGSGDSPSGSSVGGPLSAMKGGRGHVKRGSVTFQEVSDISNEVDRGGRPSPNSKKDVNLSLKDREERRRERRRSEAKAAIELGNVINGPGPQLDDDDDEGDIPLGGSMGPRASMLNPMMNQGISASMNFGAPSPINMGAWPQQHLQVPQLGSGMHSPQPFMVPHPPMNMVADPAFLAAHQQAMMIAKQAYQFAVAQQAMAVAADDWERGSNVGGYAQSAMGGSTVGFGGAGMGMGMNMGMGGWANGGSMFPSAPRSMYAGSIYGGAASDAGWGTASVYGDAFGPSISASNSPRRPRAVNTGAGNGARNSVAMPPSFQRSESSGDVMEKVSRPARPGARPRTNTAPSNAPLPSHHRNSAGLRDPIPPVPGHGSKKPPSSWKVST